MQYLVTGKEMKEYDNNTIAYEGITGLELMENAARALFQEIMALENHKRVFILCGIGNNGGDGLALARMLSKYGCEVMISVLGNRAKATESFLHQIKLLEGLDITWTNAENLCEEILTGMDVVVDALFGVGLSREITGDYAEVINCLNAIEAYKVAVDIPSGICADTGKVLGCAFRADLTVTFAFGKAGFYQYPGIQYAGKVVVRDIGITEKSFRGNQPQFFTYNENPMELLPARRPDGNKGTFGKVLVIAGFETMAGAAVLSARAALETGAGMVKVLSSSQNRSIIQTAVPELLYGEPSEVEKSLSWADVVIIGPGLGQSEEAKQILSEVLRKGKHPLVMDADALNILSACQDIQEAAKAYEYPMIFTPHMMELSRLSGVNLKDLKDERLSIAKKLSKEYHSIVVCKDAVTLVVQEDGLTYLNHSGNSGMSTAGSGDVLTGIIGALIGQGENPFEGAAKAVYIHGLAGDRAADLYTEYGVTASRLIENIRSMERL